MPDKLNPRGKNSAPRILRVFIRPPANFRQSFASRFLQNRDFSCYGEISVRITRGPLGCLLGFWPSGPKPCGSNNATVNQLFGGSSHLPTTAERAVIKSLSTVQTTKQFLAVLSWKLVERLIDGSEKRICRL